MYNMVRIVIFKLYFPVYLQGIKNWQCHLSVCDGKLVVNQLRMNQTTLRR